jgi:transposase
MPVDGGCCEVSVGNTGETTTLVPTIEKVLARYPTKRVVLVADRGLLSLDHLEAIPGAARR